MELAVDPLLEAYLWDGGTLGDSCCANEYCDIDGVDAADARLSTDFRGLAEDISIFRQAEAYVDASTIQRGDRGSDSERYADMAMAEGIRWILGDQRGPAASQRAWDTEPAVDIAERARQYDRSYPQRQAQSTLDHRGRASSARSGKVSSETAGLSARSRRAEQVFFRGRHVPS